MSRVHFIGVLGASMRGLAMLTHNIGARVSGSDSTYSRYAEVLESKGIDVYIGHDVNRVEDADYVVYSSAISQEDEELAFARSNGILCMERCEYLGLLMSYARCGIAIAGAHGKSTTTAILGSIMRTSGQNATVHIGAELIDAIENTDISEYFVTEACEYRRSFLHLRPHIGVVLNIDYDHPDEYKDIYDMRCAFNEFMSHSDIVIAHESVHYEGAITFGTSESADYIITNIQENEIGYTFDIVHNRESIALTCPLLGEHNILCVTAAYIVASLIGISDKSISEGIADFRGLRRRFEDVGHTPSGARVIHDYAHHPAEIKRAIATASRLTHGRVIVVFEPHTYSRTKSLIHEFGEAFYWADSLILLPTYSAREREEDGYTTLELIEYLRDVGEYPLYFASYTRARDFILSNATRSDIVLVLGAGSVYHLADMLVQ